MALDSVTVIIFSLLVALVVSLFAWTMVFSPLAPRWRVSWALANTCMTLGVGLMLGQNTISHWLSIVLANLLIVGGFYLLETGLRKFAGKPPSAWYPWVFFGVLMVGMVFFTFGWFSLVGRTLVHGLVVLWAVVRMLVLLQNELSLDRQHNPWMLRLFEVVLVSVAVVYVLRMGLVFGEGTQTVLDPSNSLVLLFLFTTVAMVAWTLSFVGIDVFRSQRLVEASLATRDTMFTLIAHDLRGPIGGVTALLEAAHDGTIPPDKVASVVESAAKAARESYNLLDNLLNWARSQRGDLALLPRELGVETLLEEALQPLLAALVQKNLVLTKKLDPDLRVWGDEATLQTVVRNVVSNAVKYSPLGAKITIAAWAGDDVVEVRVKDVGPGIPEQVVAQLNSARLPPSTPGTLGERGTGLGLMLCLAFVRANRGTLSFHSLHDQPTTGTEVVLTLPKR